MSGAIDEALAQLSSEHVDEVGEAMDLLRAHPDDAHEAVAAALAEHRGSQANLARLLGEWGRPGSVAILRDALERGGHTLRYAAAMALAEHADPGAGEALAEIAHGGDPEVAEMAARALAERHQRNR